MLDGGSTELEVRRLPVRQGTSSDPRLEGRRGGGAPPARSASCRRLWVAEGLECNFYLSWGSFCNVLPVISSVSLQKKNRSGGGPSFDHVDGRGDWQRVVLLSACLGGVDSLLKFGGLVLAR